MQDDCVVIATVAPAIGIASDPVFIDALFGRVDRYAVDSNNDGFKHWDRLKREGVEQAL